jgi:hypothetical protein
VPDLKTISDELRPKLERKLVEQGERKARQYRSDRYKIDAVRPKDYPQGVSYYAYTRGGDKAVDLYLCPSGDLAGAFEASIKVTHGIDVDKVEYGERDPRFGNKWFFAWTLKVTLEVLRDLGVTELVARPCGKTEDITKYLTELYEAMGFKNTGKKSKTRGFKGTGWKSKELAVLVLRLDDVKKANEMADEWLKEKEAWRWKE